MKTKASINILKKSSQSKPTQLLQVFNVDGKIVMMGSNIGGLSSRQIRRRAGGTNKKGVSRN